LLGILILLMLIKIVIWVGVGGMAWRTGISFEARYLDLLQRVSKKLGVTHTMEVRPLPRSRAQRWNPWFIGATLLSFGVFLITSRPSWVEFAFYALRVIASGILVVWVLKVISRWFPGFGAIGQPR
jgi:hypothetical protein